MTPKQFIEKAIEGGYKLFSSFEMGDTNIHFWVYEFGEVVVYFREHNNSARRKLENILLDPLAWQAVGKAEHWGSSSACPICVDSAMQTITGEYWMFDWQRYMHRMIDALCEGKTIEQFLSTL